MKSKVKQSYKVILFYKFFNIKNPEKVRDTQRKLCESFNLNGRMLLANEGINATLEGKNRDVNRYMKVLRNLNIERFKKPLKDIVFKESEGTGLAFTRLEVKMRKEVVTLGAGKFDIKKETAKTITATELEKLYKNKKEDFVILDLRNDYEIEAGLFEKTINPGLQNFRDLPEKLKDKELQKLKAESQNGKKIIPVCTGGIRCEKATCLLKREGFKNLYQLEDGIHTYMKKYPASHFKGSLFVFDNRMTTPVKDSPKREVVGKCIYCNKTCEDFYSNDTVRPSRKVIACKASRPNTLTNSALAFHRFRLDRTLKLVIIKSTRWAQGTPIFNQKTNGMDPVVEKMEIRNIAIIAHVDHGKTTLTDAILKQTGAVEEGVSMDSNALEKERGITIYAKNASIDYKDTKINIVDTPGHADFGGEVERILRSIDSVLLVVDAQEGPMPQTRFVLKKSLEIGHKPIVILNKIDKPAADPKRAHDEVFELFFDLGATEEQLDFTTVYCIGKDGVAMRNLNDERKDMTPLLDVVLEKVPKAPNDREAKLKAQPFNLGFDNFLGRLAIARVYEGVIKTGQKIFAKKVDGSIEEGKVTKMFVFDGTTRREATEVEAGDIVMIAGLPNIYIGDTICDDPSVESLPAIHVDEPTIALNFLVNNSPFAGREGKFVTSRQIRDRLVKELEINVGLKVDFDGDNMKVYGRGELHIAILLENMRREGFELQVSEPRVIIKEIDRVKSEPFEEVTIDIPSEMQGAVIEKLGKRGAIMTNMKSQGDRLRLEFLGPTRGLLGYRGQFVIDTKGEGIFASRVIGFKPYAGEIQKKPTGSMVSMATGKALAFALDNLQTRGTLYIGPTTEVYEGMVIGNTSKGDDMVVNPTKGKQLTNMRASGSDDKIYLAPPTPITIETGLEIMSGDEYLEITPKSTRLRKKYLTELERAKAGK